MKKVLFTVYTEYQLIITLNELLVNTEYGTDTTVATIVVKHEDMHKRMDRPFDFEGLGFNIVHFYDDINYKKAISKETKKIVDSLLAENWDTFILFQENDTLNCLLSYQLYKKGSTIRLYQDGLKAFNPMKSRSYGQLKYEFQMRLWWYTNGYKCDPLLNAFNAYRYGFLKGVKYVHVTFPEAYQNWNKKKLKKIEITKSVQLFELIKKVFVLDKFMLDNIDNTVFIISQSMRDDNSFEKILIDYTIKKFPNRRIYLKSHPTQYKPYRNFIEEAKTLYKNQLTVIDEPIPAEFLILQLRNSLVISTISTSMFLDNPDCRFYYTFEIARPYMPRFDRYNTINPTPHVKTVQSFDEIE